MYINQKPNLCSSLIATILSSTFCFIGSDWPVLSKLLLSYPFLLQIPIGRSCVSHYRELSRYCVFSHDEMVCNMASKADAMDVDLAAIVQKEMIFMVEQEGKLREIIKKMVSI